MTDATVPRAGLLRAAWANPILLLVLTTLIWAGHAIVGRLAIVQFGPMTLTCMRWGVALVPILAAARPSLRHDWPTLRANWLKTPAYRPRGPDDCPIYTFWTVPRAGAGMPVSGL
jgi:drug/metabolite transporter (DMT)-like permease